MAILSTTPTNLTFLLPTIHYSQPHHLPYLPLLHSSPTTRTTRLLPRPISATRFPAPPPPPPSGQVYQPFRAPPTPLPDRYRSLSATDRLDILSNRLGAWYEYAPLVSSLLQEGFTPPSIEEATGITGVEQNQLVVAAQVRETLVSSGAEAEILTYFDSGGAELLYEIRLLNTALRTACARRIVEHRLDAKSTKLLARAVKDFPRRRGDKGWECFSAASPGDCLSYSHFRMALEALSPTEETENLHRAVEAVETDKAKNRIRKEWERKGKKDTDDEEEEAARMAVPVVRLKYGEVAASTSVTVLPVCQAREGKSGVTAAPRCTPEGGFGVVAAEEAWKRWVVLPGWEPATGLAGRLAVEFKDARILPWKTNQREKGEAVLVVVDRERKEVKEDNELYLFAGDDGSNDVNSNELKVLKGRKLREMVVVEALATVVLIVRPPRDDFDEELLDED